MPFPTHPCHSMSQLTALRHRDGDAKLLVSYLLLQHLIYILPVLIGGVCVGVGRCYATGVCREGELDERVLLALASIKEMVRLCMWVRVGRYG